jgi:aryl-alcohol dehydrogenase-like predicted oxidoreductase
VGARNTEQLRESIAAAGFRLENEHMEHLNQLTEWRNG